MTSYYFGLNNKVKSNGERSIVIYLIKDGRNTTLSIRKSCKESEWSNETNRVKKNHRNSKSINAFIEKYEKIISKIIEEYELNDIPFNLSELSDQIKNYNGKTSPLTYTEFVHTISNNLKLSKKLNSASIEIESLRSLQKFMGKEKIQFNEINYSFLEKYKSYLVSKGNKNSTIGIKMRTIRATFNKAIKAQIITEKIYPFKNFKISKIKNDSKKEFLNEEEIEMLKNYKPKNKKQEFAKDMFLLSFYSRGINFIDLLLLKKSSLSKEHTNYIRRKTGARVSFKLNKFSKSIYKKYASDVNSNFLLDFIKNNNENPTYIANKNHKLLGIINPALKEIMKELDIQKHITYYCARHSFATILKFNNINIDIIKEALGHQDINSTMSYLNTLPQNKLDNVIEDIIKV